MSRLVEQIARNQRHHRRLSSAILPNVEDQCVRMRYKPHRSHHGRSAELRIHESIELDIPDVVRQNLHLVERAIVPLHLLVKMRLVLRRLLLLRRRLERIEVHPQMLVVAHPLQVFRQLHCKRIAIRNGVIVALRLMRLQHVRHLLG